MADYRLVFEASSATVDIKPTLTTCIKAHGQPRTDSATTEAERKAQILACLGKQIPSWPGWESTTTCNCWECRVERVWDRMEGLGTKIARDLIGKSFIMNIPQRAYPPDNDLRRMWLNLTPLNRHFTEKALKTGAVAGAGGQEGRELLDLFTAWDFEERLKVEVQTWDR